LRWQVNRSKLTVWRNRRDARPQAARDRSAGTNCENAAVRGRQRQTTKRRGRIAMPMSLERPKHDAMEDKSWANDLVKRIRKLRWMGLEEEAERLQQELTRRCADADSVIATPRETD
jgi:hypothetical protein